MGGGDVAEVLREIDLQSHIFGRIEGDEFVGSEHLRAHAIHIGSELDVDILRVVDVLRHVGSADRVLRLHYSIFLQVHQRSVGGQNLVCSGQCLGVVSHVEIGLGQDSYACSL